MGTKWMVSRQDYYTMEMASLKPKCRVWYHFLKTYLLPSTHNITVSKERMLMLHSIIFGKGAGQTVSLLVYVERRDTAQKRYFQKNFTKPMPAFPNFLKELQATIAKEVSEAQPTERDLATVEKEFKVVICDGKVLHICIHAYLASGQAITQEGFVC
ncbi:hypothetical protein J1N35_034060 [Gossypium stocksii]|uniref:Uncharacterized protein n=1 Tax=Gossypium stocksii TaxID=47602 RepID=A0A9D3URB3_9ROSI|nr:hypothetical protein J1N35_034060 [Gossypium stocksii]